MIKTIIHCDKCDSTDVLHEPKRERVQEIHTTMSNLIEQSKKMQTAHGAYYYTYWILLCKACGHRLEYYV